MLISSLVPTFRFDGGARLKATEALELDRDVSGLEEVRKALALLDGLASEGQEVGGLAGAGIVVPDGDTRAQLGVLGVQEGLEGVEVDTPVAVDGGLVAGNRGGGDVGLELGLANGRVTKVAGLPGLELNARHGEGGLDGHGAKGQDGGGAERLYQLVVSIPCRTRSASIKLTLENCILLRGVVNVGWRRKNSFRRLRCHGI